MKKKIIYIVLALVFIASIIITATIGLKVDLNYGEGTTVTFTVGKDLTTTDIKAIAKDVFGSSNLEVQKVELFGDSASIKVASEISDEQITTLCDKINEKYETELKTEAFVTEHVSNVKLRNVIEPYILPMGLSTLLIVAYYAVRYKGTKNMINLLALFVIGEGILYSAYALCRIPVSSITMPIALIIYAGIALIYTLKCECGQDSRKAKRDAKKPE